MDPIKKVSSCRSGDRSHTSWAARGKKKKQDRRKRDSQRLTLLGVHRGGWPNGGSDMVMGKSPRELVADQLPLSDKSAFCQSA